MKLLIVTQAVDEQDPVLGFFVGWVREFAKHVERIEVICLTEGKHALPENVRVHSLGKEGGRPLFGAFSYASRFKRLAWKLRRDYDAVFVHMNQEYVLIAGALWKLLGKRIYLWRNHYAGSWLTDLAASLCTKVFCTSKHSYTAKYKKTVRMPVGIDTSVFHPDSSVERVPRSVLFLARMAPSKRAELLIDALERLNREGVPFSADFVGSPLPAHEAYYAGLQKKVRDAGLAERISFAPGVPNAATPDLYRAHQVFVNASPSGMFDKTLFEAAACGCRVLASSDDWRDLAGTDAYFDSSEALARRLREALESNPATALATVVTANSLETLANRLGELL